MSTLSQTTEASGTLTIRIGDQDWEKPWDASCAACTSTWLGQIDSLLASGWTPESIHARMRGRKPAPPRPAIIKDHVPHLAQPHYEQRLAYDRQRGLPVDPGVPVPELRDVADAALQRVYSGMAAGTIMPPLRDVIAALRLRQQLDAESAGTASQAAMQEAMIAIFEIARRHLAGPQWEAFTRDVYASEALVSLIRPRPQAAIPGKEAV